MKHGRSSKADHKARTQRRVRRALNKNTDLPRQMSGWIANNIYWGDGLTQNCLKEHVKGE